VDPPIHRIPPNQKTRIVVRPIHGAFVIDNLHIANAGSPEVRGLLRGSYLSSALNQHIDTLYRRIYGPLPK
jgi:hypothetical protein